jgi:hypothetical protein
MTRRIITNQNSCQTYLGASGCDNCRLDFGNRFISQLDAVKQNRPAWRAFNL